MRIGRWPLHVHISSIFVTLVLAVGTTVALIGFTLSRQLIEANTIDLVTRISAETADDVQRLVAPAQLAARVISHDPITSATDLDARLERLSALLASLTGAEAASAVYVGYPDGSFFLLRRFIDADERELLGAPSGAAYLVQSIERGGDEARGNYLYLDATLALLRRDDRPDYPRVYDPRTRSWFERASAEAGPVRTDPYVFFSNRLIGVSVATPAANGAVVGVDLTLASLAARLAQQQLTSGSELALVDARGLVVAYPDAARLTRTSGEPDLVTLDALGVPALSAITERGLGAASEHSGRLVVAGRAWRTSIVPVPVTGGDPWTLVSAVPERELLSAATQQRSTSLLVTLAVVVLAIPLTYLVSQGVARPLRQLAGAADAIRRFDFDTPVGVRTRVREVHALAQTMDALRHTIRRFLDVSEAVANESDIDRLLPRLLAETASAADADSGVLFLAQDHDQLVPMARLGPAGASLTNDAEPVPVSSLGPLLERGVRTLSSVIGPASDVDLPRNGLASGASDEARHALAVPLVNRERRLVGAMLLLRSSPIGPAQVAFTQALSSTATSSLEARELISAQRRLFDAFIRMIAGAIDAKSPYTGAHCARVPELATLLARAACDATDGPYADFALDGADWEALHVAAWLHDCGKVTTPEFVIDKATKLETVYDRIHEVRMRFEVLKRDAEIEALRAIADGADEARTRAALAERWAELDDDFAFVASCNLGAEAMEPARVARLERIAQRRWLRTLDDALGVSDEERRRKAPHAPATLPVEEPLLADKPEHRIAHSSRARSDADAPTGISMPVPELRYHRGELHNLRVARGTLTAEERHAINEHVVETIRMLQALPFPRHLRDVPEIAGAHHEKIDGSGYPRGLHGAQMSPLARMLAIADVFEALTAPDRPYKRSAPLSAALRIMASMASDGHIDRDLFRLFLRSGAYRSYAEQRLRGEQLDEVDVEGLLAGV